ncbi:MAG: hypothetical protein EBZ59_03030, partial [Planctomycetia bacterium]|nr:hypothetical protein [Planctomycetia bacterium]
MPTSIADCAECLSDEGIRHHVDAEQDTIRIVLVTRRYRNLRGERLLVMTLETPDDGRRCRLSVIRAFATGGDVPATCLALCRLAADTPLVSAEFDADFDDLRMVVETAVEDGELTRQQLVAMVDRLAEAAEA